MIFRLVNVSLDTTIHLLGNALNVITLVCNVLEQQVPYALTAIKRIIELSS
jgi:hypothetical protein